MAGRTEELLKWDTEYVVHALGHVGKNLGFAFEKAEGIKIWDSDGREYIDLASQLVNVNLGHNHPALIQAAKEQMDQMLFAATLRGYSNVASIEYAHKLTQWVPKELGHFLFTMTGGDADDAAFKIANLYYQVKRERRYKIISLFNSYHGTLRGTGGATGVGRQMHAQCPPCGVHLHAPNYHCYRCPLHVEYPGCGIACAEYLDYLIENEGPDTVACFIAEPEQGAGGFISPPPEYFPRVKEICNKHGVLFISDEVMTGFGRTGKMWGIEHGNVIPDMITMSKGIVSAYLPFGAVAISDEIFNTLRGHYISAGSSESGNPICCAVASKVLDIYKDQKINEHAAAMGQHAWQRFEKEFLPLPHVGHLGGLGLMLGLEIVVDKKTKAALDPEETLNIIQDRAFKEGLYLRVMSNRICFSPPLIITKEELDNAIDRLYSIVSELKLK